MYRRTRSRPAPTHKEKKMAEAHRGVIDFFLPGGSQSASGIGDGSVFSSFLRPLLSLFSKKNFHQKETHPGTDGEEGGVLSVWIAAVLVVLIIEVVRRRNFGTRQISFSAFKSPFTLQHLPGLREWEKASDFFRVCIDRPDRMTPPSHLIFSWLACDVSLTHGIS